jgi:peptide/nickel transport system ATP-binding protein
MTDAETEPALLEVDDLVVRYFIGSGLRGKGTTVEAVAGVSFTVAAGETLALVGESGSGKTTTGRAILGLAPIVSGSVRLQGVDITHARGEALRAARRKMQLVYQNPFSSLNPYMTALDLVVEPLTVNHLVSSRQEAERRAGEFLELVALPPALWKRRPRGLSGGQLQRVAIARALAVGPRLLVADEPVSKLDVSIQAQVINLLQDIQSELGVSYLFITHNLAVVRHMAHRVAIMQGGRLVETGETGAVFEAPQEAYTKELLAAVPRLTAAIPEGEPPGAACD